MHVWTSYAKNNANCKLKERCRFGKLKTGDPVIRVRDFYNTKYGKKYRYDGMYHFNCWVDQAEHWFAANPFVAEERKPSTGRPKLDITEKQRKRRASLHVKLHRKRKDRRYWLELGVHSKAEEIMSQINSVKKELDEMLVT